MLIAQQKKKENIAEYLLYMWQVEEMLRACKFDMELVREYIVDKFNQPETVKKEIEDWYENLAEMVKNEHIQEKGHLQINKNLVSDLTHLHQELLKSPSESVYASVYYQTLPYIVELRSKGDKEVSEIETCFTALYGVLMLKMQGKEVSSETENAIKQISKLIALLAKKYKDENEENIDHGG